MTMQPQPPPDAPAPPPSEMAMRSQRKMQWIWMVGVGSVALLIVGLCNAVHVQRREAATTEAYSNLRSMSVAFSEFEHEYGKYPDASTIASVLEHTETAYPLGSKSSNDFFRQLIASGISQSEILFYADIPNVRKPNNRLDGRNAIEKGECGFSYIFGLSSKSNSTCPLVVTPLIPGTARFDPKPFNGYALVMWVDGVVRAMNINPRGEVLDSSGKHILDPSNPIWNGHPPAIAWPDL